CVCRVLGGANASITQSVSADIADSGKNSAQIERIPVCPGFEIGDDVANFRESITLSQRNTVSVDGEVASVSADRLSDQFTLEGYYPVSIGLPAGIQASLGSVSLRLGMQAAVMIVTGANTALGYLMKPLAESFKRAFLED
ncbi:MAG: hypothetical protein ACKVH1_04980, partial [Alphaproteobacteria bacterium]